MTKLIYNYLNKFYHIEGDRIIGPNGYYIRYNVLIHELSIIFGLHKISLRRLIRNWVLNKDANFSFRKYFSAKINISVSWNHDMANDLANMHNFGIDLEQELVNHVSQMIDREILQTLFTLNRTEDNTTLNVTVQPITSVKFIDLDFTLTNDNGP